jgi:hypothetical protein
LSLGTHWRNAGSRGRHGGVDAADELPRLEEVVASHLVRFGERDELSVQWVRGTDG